MIGAGRRAVVAHTDHVARIVRKEVHDGPTIATSAVVLHFALERSIRSVDVQVVARRGFRTSELVIISHACLKPPRVR